MKIDTSKFKKVDCDDDCTTLAHPSGHQIKIAHKGLSPELREQLDSVPMNLAKGGYAKFAQKYDPNMGSKGSKPSQVSNPAAGPTNLVPKPARKAYTEPDDGGTDVMIAALNREAPPFGPLAAEEKQHYPPCINPSCKSFGKPHPNCKCYGGTGGSVAEQGHFAEGGEVEKEYYCDDTRAHKKSCEYYKGGEVKGVHKPYFDKEGESVAGDKVRSMDIKKDSKKQAIDEHHKVLGEMRSMPKPKIQGFANGGIEDGMTLSPSDIDPSAPINPNLNKNTPMQEEINKSYAEQNPSQEQSMSNLAGLTNAKAQAQDVPPAVGPQPPLQSVPPNEGSDIKDEMDSADSAANKVEPLQPQHKPVIQQAQEHAENVKNEILHEDQAIKHDLANGYIQPEHYEDHMGKGFLGKLGTMFAMMVGGGGAALAGQPNMLMEMMNNEIKNNLQAKEASAKGIQAAQRNKAEIGGIQQDTARKKMTMDLIRDRNFTIHKLDRIANTYPVGSKQYNEAKAAIMLMQNGADKETMDGATQLAFASALAHFGLGSNDGQQNTQFMKSGMMGPGFERLGQDIEQKTIPGIPGQASRPIDKNDRDQIQAMSVLSDKANDLMSFAKKHKGTLSPAQRAIAQQKAEELINFYNSSIQGGVLTQGRLEWLDSQIKKNPTGIVTQLMGNQERLQEIKNSNDHRKDLLLSTYNLKSPQNSKKDQHTENNGYQMSGGKAYKLDPTGKFMVPVK